MYSDSVPSSPKPWIKVGYTKKDSREGLREGTRHEIHLENDGMGGKRKALRDELASRDQMPAITGIYYVWTCRWQRELKHLLPRTSEIIGTVRNFPEYLGWRRIQLLHSKNKKRKERKKERQKGRKEGKKERKEKRKEKKREKERGRAWGLLDNIFPSCL